MFYTGFTILFKKWAKKKKKKKERIPFWGKKVEEKKISAIIIPVISSQTVISAERNGIVFPVKLKL